MVGIIGEILVRILIKNRSLLIEVIVLIIKMILEISKLLHELRKKGISKTREFWFVIVLNNNRKREPHPSSYYFLPSFCLFY